MYNSFLDYATTTDVKIEFDGEVYFEVLDPDTGEASYLIIDALIGRETKKKPETGAIVLKEEKVGEREGTLLESSFEKEETKKSLWDEEFKIDLDYIESFKEWNEEVAWFSGRE